MAPFSSRFAGRTAFVLAALGVSGCRGATAKPPRTASLVPAAPLSPTVVHPDDAKDSYLAWASLPGCTAAEAREDRARVAALHRPEPRPRDGEPLPATLERALDALWESPCLVHVTRFTPRPRPSTFAEFQELWHRRELKALMAMIGGLYLKNGQKNGERHWILPPTTPMPLADDIRSALAPWLCPEKETRCGNAGTYVAHAEKAFDAHADSESVWHARRRSPVCVEARSTSPAAIAQGQSSFEAWADCVGTDSPRTYRYPKLRYRAPEKGWLVLRGRRGHYSFSDEIRVYDLETGAAYVSSSRTELVLEGIGVDHDAVDAKRSPEAYAGNVAPGAVRELAFVLLTSKAPVPMRPISMSVVVPDELEVTLSPRAPGFTFSTEPPEWHSSAQTSIAYTLLDNGKLVAEGEFTWPDSSAPAEQYADDLLTMLEGGLERGCARAKLPARLGKSGGAVISPIDADQGRQVVVSQSLERALEGLRPKACPGAR